MYVAVIPSFFTSAKQGPASFFFKGSESVHAAFSDTYGLSSNYSALSSSIKAILYNIYI